MNSVGTRLKQAVFRKRNRRRVRFRRKNIISLCMAVLAEMFRRTRYRRKRWAQSAADWRVPGEKSHCGGGKPARMLNPSVSGFTVAVRRQASLYQRRSVCTRDL